MTGHMGEYMKHYLKASGFLSLLTTASKLLCTHCEGIVSHADTSCGLHRNPLPACRLNVGTVAL